MKKQAAVVSALIAVSAFVSVVSAKTPESEYIESYRGKTGTPVPVKVVRPEVSVEFVGRTVNLEFVVDPSGRPGPIVARSAAAEDLVGPIARAVSRWKFEPLRNAQGEAVAARVTLPVTVTEPRG